MNERHRVFDSPIMGTSYWRFSLGERNKNWVAKLRFIRLTSDVGDEPPGRSPLCSCSWTTPSGVALLPRPCCCCSCCCCCCCFLDPFDPLPPPLVGPSVFSLRLAALLRFRWLLFSLSDFLLASPRADLFGHSGKSSKLSLSSGRVVWLLLMAALSSL